jgi:flagellar biosynthetic protein FliR
MLRELITGDLFALVFVFARIGAAVMLLPGFGEVFVAARIRLLLAVGITVVVAPVVAPYVPPTPVGPLNMFAAIGQELVIGLFIGAMARMMVAALHTAGVIIGFQTSLANAQLFDPVNANQGSLIGSFLNVLGVFLIFAANLHHLMLMAVIDSYSLFVPGAALPVGDFSDVAARILSQSFLLAMQLSAPFIVMGMLFYLGMGLLARLMPQVQIVPGNVQEHVPDQPFPGMIAGLSHG